MQGIFSHTSLWQFAIIDEQAKPSALLTTTVRFHNLNVKLRSPSVRKGGIPTQPLSERNALFILFIQIVNKVQAPDNYLFLAAFSRERVRVSRSQTSAGPQYWIGPG